MQQFRIHPKATARKMLHNLEEHKPLTKTEETRIVDAIKSTGIPNCVERMLANLSANTLRAFLTKI